MLSLGIGIANAAGKGDSSLSGFGVVTMASLFPILAVLVLAIFVSFSISPEEIIANAAAAGQSASSEPLTIWQKTPLVETVLGVRAILPLVLFLMFVLFVILKSKLPNKMVTVYGLALSIIGMCIFNIGLTYGLGAIGTQTGAFSQQHLWSCQLVKVPNIFKSTWTSRSYWLCFSIRFGATLQSQL